MERLTILEDVLEKYGIDNLEDFIKEYSSRNIKLANDNYDLEQELAELKQKAIVPKFKVGQEIWETTPLMSWKIKRIECHKFDGGNGDVVMEIYRLGHDMTDDYNCCILPSDNDIFFATKEEAEQKLAEIGGKDE